MTHDFESLADVDRLALSDPGEFDRLLGGYQRVNGKPKGVKITTRKLSSYKAEPVKWLWAQRIPQGKVSVLAGDAGEGKSFATLGIAASLTMGWALPAGHPRVPRNVLIWNGEDGPEDTIVIRARDSGADLDRIDIIDETDDRGKRRPFALGDIPLLAERVERDPELALVIIDPVTALLNKVDSNRDAEIRSALQPLAEMALRTGVAVLLVMHLKKGEELNVLHRVSGSVAFGALARSVMLLSTHALSGRKSIDCVKHNLAQGRPEPIEFTLGEDGFRWVGKAPDLTAEAIMMSKIQARKGQRGEGAEEYLKATLAQGPVNSKEIFQGAYERGISTITLKRAKSELGIKARKVGLGEGSHWMWEMDESLGSNNHVRRESVIQNEEYQRTPFARERSDDAFDSLIADADGKDDLLDYGKTIGIFDPLPSS